MMENPSNAVRRRQVIAAVGSGALAGIPGHTSLLEKLETETGTEARRSPALSEGVINHWQFDEGSGQQAHDTSDRGHTLTLGIDFDSASGNAPRWTETARSGTALEFEADNSEYLGRHDDLNWIGMAEFSVSAWVNPDDLSSVRGVWQASAGNNQRVGAMSENSMIYEQGEDYGNTGLWETSYTFNSGVWYHLVWTFSETQNDMRFYVNGEQIRSWNITRDLSPDYRPIEKNDGGYIGRGSHPIPSSKETIYFDGIIDEILVYGRALSDTEVEQLYDRTPEEEPSHTTITTQAGAAVQDTDGDGVIDSEDYAPQDPNVQERANDQTGGESQNKMPVFPMILGALGLGGVGAWWYRRRSGSTPSGGKPSGSDPTGGSTGSPPGGPRLSDASADGASGNKRGPPTSRASTAARGPASTSSESDPEQPADSRLLAGVHDSLTRGDTLRNKASDHRDTGEYDRALEIYDRAQEAYRTALEVASESGRIDTDEIDQKLAAVDIEKRETHRQQLQEDVESLVFDLNRVDTLVEVGHFERARNQLAQLESRLTSAKETAIHHDFADLRDEITSLEKRRGDRLEEVTRRLNRRHIPDKIPREPTVSVDYDALSDKEPIGGGGNADVTKATLPTSEGGVTLAIKEPRMGGTLHTDRVERMLNEAETWDQLDDHDHIVGVVDYGSEPIPWIAMEYMDGGHLGDRSSEMDTPQALWTAIAVTKGVRHAHRRGVAHLDLKPENVLFRTVKNAWDVPKVADWGLSKHLLDHSKSIEGYTPTYSAPEQLDNEYGSADDITDVYQLGAVFYELFTGRPPFRGDSTGQVVRRVLTEQPTPPSEFADVPRDLDDVLLTALAKEKADRYESVLLLRNALQEQFDSL